MTAWLVAAIPVLIMLFALTMERLENRLRHLAVQDNAVQGTEVEEFLRAARPDEMRALLGSGIGGALDLFRRRRLSRTGLPDGSGPRNVAMVTARRTRQRS